MRRRLTVDPLSGEIPVIDPSCMTVTFEMLVGEVCPLFPQQVQKLARLQASILFLGETDLVHLAFGYHDVAVDVPIVCATVRHVDADIRDEATPNEGRLHKILQKPNLLNV